MVAVEKNQPATIQNANKPIRDALKLLKLTVQQASFSLTVSTFIIAKVSTQKQD